MNCTLKATSQCSPLTGECCSANCTTIGLTVFANKTIATANSTQQLSLADGGLLCGSELDCNLPRYCINDPIFKGTCPPSNWIYDASNLTLNQANCTDESCVLDAAIPPCISLADPQSQQCYFYHKQLKTICNFGANVCLVSGCLGSICLLYTPTNQSGMVPSEAFVNASIAAGKEVAQCFLHNSSPSDTSACQIACTFQDGVCSSLSDYANTDHGRALNITSGIVRVGRLCNDNNPSSNYTLSPCPNSCSGTCASSGTCVASGNTDQAITDVSSWLASNWPIALGVVAGVVVVTLLAKYTYRSKRVRIEDFLNRASKTMKRAQQTLMNKTLGRKKKGLPSPRSQAAIARPPGVGNAPHNPEERKALIVGE